jgi:hypothetical protein
MRTNPLNILILAGFLTLAQSTQIVLAECPQFSNGLQVGTVSHVLLIEISGIAASRNNPGVVWAHNDAGNLPRLWAFNTQGTHLGTYNLTGATARDWEDMAIGPGPASNQYYLYVADTGNNDGLTDFTFTIYRVPEPTVSAGQSPVDVNLNSVDTLLVRYPDSLRHDCETMLVDPLNSDIYICTRDRWGDDQGVMKVYRYPAPHTPGVEYTMQHVADVQLINGEMAVGGDVSLNGSLIIIRTKGNAMRALIWQRDRGTNLWQAFDNPMCIVPQIDEPQGEAVCFEANGCGYYTVSEGANQPIYYFARNGTCPIPTGDLNWDGYVDLADLAILLSHWLQDSLTPQNLIVLDDFESYNNTSELETQWYDYADSPIQTLETQEVYSDAKSMKIDYSGSQPTVQKNLGTPQDWTIYENVKIHFKGRAANKPKDITLTLSDAVGATAAATTFIDGTKIKNWTTLETDLDPANPLIQTIKYVNLTINAEGKSGTVYFDNLEVITTEPEYVCHTTIYEDLDADCWIAMPDFAILADHWLEIVN